MDLWEATRTHPQHEGLTGQLMRALYQAGRQNEALAEYRRIRAHLRDEFGVDPGAELQRLELAILRGDVPVPPGPRESTSPGSPDPSRRRTRTVAAAGPPPARPVRRAPGCRTSPGSPVAATRPPAWWRTCGATGVAIRTRPP